jgi:hypothetical protein
MGSEHARELVACGVRNALDERGYDGVFARNPAARFRCRIGATATLVSWGKRMLTDAMLARAVRREFQLSD